ncbi:hypothetical protein NBRC116493_19630 [Aurantivibrio infirmus]
MSSNSTNALISDIEMDDWSDSEDEDQGVSTFQDIDSRRMVENKLEDLRLLRETSDYDFDY